MKYIVLTGVLVLVLLLGEGLPQAQARPRRLHLEAGEVTFVTPMNIYVRFKDTRGISAGDTLYAKRDGRLVPVMVAKYMSSISCAGPIVGRSFLKTGDRVYAYAESAAPAAPAPAQAAGHEVDTTLAAEAAVSSNNATVQESASTPVPITVSPRVFGGITVNSYSSFSNFSSASNVQRWNYSMNMNADNIGGTNFSFVNYMYFTYLGSQWHQITASPLNNLRVYNFAVGYKTPSFQLWGGRYINNDIAGVGPVDGLQAEEHFGSFTAGEVAGSRPDFYTLGVNPNLLQFGGFLSKADTMNFGTMKNTVGAFQQFDGFKTDRRFIYFQHTSNLFRNVNVYASGQVDMFDIANGLPKNDLSLTELYFTTAYTPIDRVSFNVSYSAMRNIIYYQSFAPSLISLLQSQNNLRHDIRLGADVRPFPYTFIMLGGGYSFQRGDANPTRDIDISVTQSNIPLLLVSATAYYDRMYSVFMNGSIISLSFSKFIPFNSTSVMAGCSRVDYSFGTASFNSIQYQPSVQLTTRLLGNLFFNLYYQGTYTGPTSYGTFMGGLTQRF